MKTHSSREARILIVVALMLFAALSTPCPAQPQIHVSTPEVFLSTTQLHKMGFVYFPDGSIFPGLIQGNINYFAANGGANNDPLQGTIVLDGNFQPLFHQGSGQPVASLRSGLLQPPPPDGIPFDSAFDHDYAGGGPVFWDQTSSSLIQIYHGEYHFNGVAQDFYTSLGLAISSDEGKTFKKLGLAIRPELSPDLQMLVPSSSGTLVQKDGYFYLYYGDRGPTPATGTVDYCHDSTAKVSCLAVARAKINDVMAAALHGEVAPWFKYYQKSFSEPGNGGRFTPLFIPNISQWVRWPVVRYDPHTMTLIMVYAAGATGLVLSTSTDGLNWGNPAQIVFAPANEWINYAGIVTLNDDVREDETNHSTAAFDVLYEELPIVNNLPNFRERTVMKIHVKLDFAP